MKTQPTSFNELSPAQAERLALLIEEMGEALQALGKIQRHGFDKRHPAGGPTNRQQLEHELGHVQTAIALMCKSQDIKKINIDASKNVKDKTIGLFLHEQPKEARHVLAR